MSLRQPKRLALATIAALAMFAVVACQPPPPPRGWVPPVIQSVAVGAEVVTPGTEFTLTVTATDDQGIRWMSLYFVQPTGTYASNVDCSYAGQDSVYLDVLPAQKVLTAVVTCNIPAGINGDWTVRTSLADSEGFVPGRSPSTETSFRVDGGSDDRTPPVVESTSIAPSPLIQGTKFDVIVTVRDETAMSPSIIEPTMSYFGPEPNGSGRQCGTARLRIVSPTVHEWTLRCPPNNDGKFGTYRAVFQVWDAVGNLTDGTSYFEILPKP